VVKQTKDVHVFAHLTSCEIRILARLSRAACRVERAAACDSSPVAGWQAGARQLYYMVAAAFVLCSHRLGEVTGLDITSVDAMRLFWLVSGAASQGWAQRADVAGAVSGVYHFDYPPLRRARLAMLKAADAGEDLRSCPRLWEARAKALAEASRMAPPPEAYPFPLFNFEALVVRMVLDRGVAEILWRKRRKRQQLDSR
jgi:hypothetical protein